jgi:hypothetical protein
LKTLLLQFRSLLFFLGLLITAQHTLAQSASFGTLTGGLVSGPTSGQSKVPLIGFSATVSGGSITFNQFNLGCSAASQSFLANGTLYRSTTNSYNSSSPGAPVGNVTFNGTSITVENFKETITNTTNYYFLVADIINTTSDYCQLFINSGNFAADVNSNTYAAWISNYQGSNFGTGTPYPVRITNSTTDLSSASTIITSGTTGLKLFAFSVTTSANTTISGFKINSTVSTLSSYFNNFKLYGSTTNSFPGGSPLATGSASGSYVNFTSLSQTVSNSTKYYWLVADCSVSGSVPASVQFNFQSGQSAAAVTASNPNTTYNTFTAFGGTYNVNTASLAISSRQTGLTSTTVYPGQTGVGVFGFSISASSGTCTLSQININSDNASLSSYYNNFKLYRSASSTFNPANPGTSVGAATVNASFVNVTGLNESVTGTEIYYFLVAEVIYSGTSSNNTSFKFVSGQSSAALIQSSPASNYNTFSITGNTYSITQPTINVAGVSTGLAANNSALVYGQTGIGVFGFSIAVTGTAKIAGVRFNDATGNTLQNVFNNGKLYRGTSDTFNPANIGSYQYLGPAMFNGNTVTVSGMNETVANTTQYYYLVADDIYYGTAGAFQPVMNQITTTSGVATSLNIYQNYYQFTRPAPGITYTSVNSLSNGITPGALQYGQSGIILYGFKVDVTGVTNITQFNIYNTTGTNTYFNSGTLYTTTALPFSTATATPVSGASVNFNQSYVSVSLSDAYNTYTSATSKYYFLVANYDNANASTSGIIKYGLTSGQGQPAIISSAGNHNSFTVTDGNPFVVGLTYDWAGSYSNNTSFSEPSNYRNLNGGSFSTAPGIYDQVRIGVVPYANNANTQPNVSTSPTISKLTFGTNNSPQLTVSTGTLTVNGGVVFNASAAPTIIGPGTLNVSGISTMASTAVLNLSNNVTINNTGTFTLKSDANSSAAIAVIPGGSKITGNFNVERYLTGGNAKYRGYRLLSSPVNISSKTNGTGDISLNYIGSSSNVNNIGAMTGGPGGSINGFTIANGTPTIYLYDERVTASGTGFNSGRHKGITKLNADNTVSIAGGASATTTLTNQSIPVGNGYIFYYAGDNLASSLVSNQTSTGIPSSIAITSTGYLNQGPVTVNLWTSPQSDGPATGKLSFANATTTSKGFNMVGNPYASTIDLTALYNTNNNASTGIFPTIYLLNPDKNTGQGYVVYNAATGASSLPTKSKLTNAALVASSRYVVSGQGFIVQARSTSTKLTFDETHKVPAQQRSGGNLLMGLPKQEYAQSNFFMKMEQDSIVSDYCGIYFSNNNSDGYDENDAIDLDAASPKVYMSSYTTDTRRTAINSMGDYTNGKNIKLYVNSVADGLYKLKIEEITNIDTLYDIWLMDKLTRDSLDMRHNRVYTFRITRSDANTWGANRFDLVIRRKAVPPYQLISFSAEKVTEGILLKWKAYNEANYTGFVIEKQDGAKQYVPIYQLQSDGRNNYTYVDKNPVTGNNFYRLKQDDLNNKISYAEASIDNNKKLTNNPIQIYPNPTPSVINISMNSSATANNNNKMMVYNTSGRLVLQKNFTGATYSQDVSQLIYGTYVVEIQDNGGNVVGKTKFVKY